MKNAENIGQISFMPYTQYRYLLLHQFTYNSPILHGIMLRESKPNCTQNG